MNYQKLAKVLLRILSVWILVQNIPQVAAGIYFTSTQLMSAGSGVRSYMWNAPIVGVVTLVLCIIVYCTSDRLAKIIAEES